MRAIFATLASSLLGRLKMHLRDRHSETWDRFSIYLTLGPAYMKEIESVLIRISNPIGNKQRGKLARSENLLPKVRAEYRRRRKKEEEDLFGRGGRAPTPKKKRGKRVAGRRERGRTPPLAPYAGKVKRLRTRYKGKLIYARVLKDGQVSLGGERYLSPSKAGCAAKGRKTCSGWFFWKYQRAPGHWVPINELRK